MFHANIQVLGSIKHTDSVDFGSDTRALKQNYLFDFTEGTGDNQAQTAYSDSRTLAGSANEDISLLTALPDIISPALTPSKLRLLLISADALNAGNLVVSPSASNGFVGPFGGTSPSHTVKPGGLFLLIEPIDGGWTLDSSHNSINIANGGASDANYSILALAV